MVFPYIRRGLGLPHTYEHPRGRVLCSVYQNIADVLLSPGIIAIGGWRVGETRLKMTWRLAAGRENADTWTYLQNTPGGLRNIGQEQGHITGFHLGRGKSLPHALFF
jgi:hypothetical protein